MSGASHLDEAARARASAEFERPLRVEAGAGTGKTRTLVARIGAWLLGDGWARAAGELAEERRARGDGEPTAAEIAARACEGVAAITFTDAAAAEMAHRVETMLAEAAADGRARDLSHPPKTLAPTELAARAAVLLSACGRLRISTIHGFCHRLLAEFPIEARLHPGFQVDADGERTLELATDVLVRRLREGDERIVELLAEGVDPPALLEVLRALVAAGVSPDELAADPFAGGILDPRFAALEAAILEVVRRAGPVRASRKAPSIGDGLAALERLRDGLVECAPDEAGLIALQPLLDVTAKEAGKILGGWAKGRFGRTEQDGIADLEPLRVAAAAVARERRALAELDPRRLRLARAALASPLGEVAARRHAEGVVSFDELLERAVRLLAERPAVRARVRRGLRQLLVDEFQDTDARQCELVRWLVLADGGDDRPGLFLVGDPKQSIYGWRSADLAAYAAFGDELRRAGGETASLIVNFRSVPAVLAEVERALAPVLVHEPGIQAGFERLEPSREHASEPGFTAEGRAPVEYWDTRDARPEADSAARTTAIEAVAVARDVREIVVAKRATWGDFAILLRARGDLDVYLDALRRAEVPYVVQKDRSYYRRREVVDAAAGVRAILDPVDLLALVAFLRSPFVGVPDAAWIPLWRAGFPAAMVELDGTSGLERALDAVRSAGVETAALAPGAGGWADSLAHAVETIGVLRAEFRSLPAEDWVERLRCRFLLEPIAAARFLGRFGLANLERLLAEIAALLAEEADPARALARLRLAVARETPTEEARPPDATGDAVSVMTIHTAKGLQFEHVYLVQAQRRSGRTRGDDPPELAIGPPAQFREMSIFGAPTPGWRESDRRARRVAAAEAARVLYVATTRAIRRLVITGRLDPASKPCGPEEVPSFADLLRHRWLDAVATTGPAPVVDAAGVRWRAPGCEPGWSETAGAGLAATPPASVPPDVAELEALADRRDAARARAARPRLVPASELGGAPAVDPAPRRSPGRPGAEARALGTSLHRALELAAAPREHRDDAARAVYRGLRPEAAAAELEALDSALERLGRGRLGLRLGELESYVLARELPLLAAADPARPDGPIDGVTGTLDLLYTDPADGRPVVADFKSDAILDDDALDQLVDRYRPQLELYGRAVRDALGLDAPPRLELWLIGRDEIRAIETPENGPPALR